MQFRTTLILLVLMVLLVSAVLWTRSKPVAPSAGEAVAARLLNLKESDVTGVTIADGKSEVLLSIVRDDAAGKGWRMENPAKGEAEAFEADELVRLMIELEVLGKGTESAVANPAYVVTLAQQGVQGGAQGGANGGVTKLEVSEPSAAGDVFVRVNGAGDVQAVSRRLTDRLERAAELIRPKDLLDIKREEIAKVEWENGADQSVTRLIYEPTDAAKPWRVESGDGAVSGRADEGGASSVLFALTGLRADAFPEATTGESIGAVRQVVRVYGKQTDEPVAVIEVGRFEDIRKQRALVRVTSGGMNTFALVRAASLEPFGQSALDLKDKTVLNLPGNVKRVEIARSAVPLAEAKVVLEKRETLPSESTTQEASTRPTENAVAWFVGETRLPQEKVDALVSALSPLRATKWLAKMPSESDGANQQYQISLGEGEGAMKLKLAAFENKLGESGAGGERKRLIGTYDGQIFEVSAGLAEAVDALLEGPGRMTPDQQPTMNPQETK